MSRQPLTDAQAEAGFRPAPFTDAEWQAIADDSMNVGDIGERLAWLEARVAELSQHVEHMRRTGVC